MLAKDILHLVSTHSTMSTCSARAKPASATASVHRHSVIICLQPITLVSDVHLCNSHERCLTTEPFLVVVSVVYTVLVSPCPKEYLLPYAPLQLCLLAD